MMQTILKLTAIGLVAILAGCFTPRIETRSRVKGEVSAARSVHLLPIERPGVPPDDWAATEKGMSGRVSEILTRKGYRVGPAEGSDLRISIAGRVERVTRRTWSSDPDASALENVEVSEAVLVVSAFDDRSNEAVWSVEARSLLPEIRPPFAPTHREIWLATLRDAAEAFPPSTSASPPSGG